MKTEFSSFSIRTIFTMQEHPHWEKWCPASNRGGSRRRRNTQVTRKCVSSRWEAHPCWRGRRSVGRPLSDSPCDHISAGLFVSYWSQASGWQKPLGEQDVDYDKTVSMVKYIRLWYLLAGGYLQAAASAGDLQSHIFVIFLVRLFSYFYENRVFQLLHTDNLHNARTSSLRKMVPCVQ